MQNKNKVKSNLDRVRDELLSEAPVSRLNYRDESSGPIQTEGDTTFGKHWNANKSNKQKLNRKQRKKVTFKLSDFISKIILLGKNQLMARKIIGQNI